MMDVDQCVLNCKGATHFFEFPEEDIVRNLWLYSLGLDDCDSSARVCNQHFSDNMLIAPNKLEELAIPDKNLPNASEKNKGTYDQLRDKTTSVKPPSKNLSQPATNSNNIASTNKLINDSSQLLIDYELRVQGKYICDVIEVPEYVVVITVPIPRAAKGLSPSELAQILKKKKVADALTKLSPAISVSRTKCKKASTPPPLPPTPSPYIAPPKPTTMNFSPPKPTKYTKPPPQILTRPLPNKLTKPPPKKLIKLLPRKPAKPAPSQPVEVIELDNSNDSMPNIKPVQEREIKFVYYMTGDAKPRREREIQACINSKTVETAIQCDVQLDSDLAQMNRNPELYWVENESDTVTKHECLECGEVVSSGLPKIWHAYDHQQSCALCPQCGVMCASENKLKRHEKRIHQVNDWEIRKAERCPKLHCNKAFHSRKQLLRHIDDHLRGDIYKCNKCRRVFNSALKLRRHEKVFQNCLRQIWPRVKRRHPIIQ